MNVKEAVEGCLQMNEDKDCKTQIENIGKLIDYHKDCYSEYEREYDMAMKKILKKLQGVGRMEWSFTKTQWKCCMNI